MATSERVPVELCKGVNGLEKVVLREVRGGSAEVSAYLDVFAFDSCAFLMWWSTEIDSAKPLPFQENLSVLAIREIIFHVGSGDDFPLPMRTISRDSCYPSSEIHFGFGAVKRGGNLDLAVMHANFAFLVCKVIYLYGAHVTSWKNEHGDELLFVSAKTFTLRKFKMQFSNQGSLEQHGFARTKFWSIDTDPPPFPTSTSNKALIDLILKPTEEDMKIWPHSYEFRLRVTLGPGGDLMLTSRIRNTSADGKPFSFTFAYHTYFSVSDISEVRVEGLETIDYLDNLQNKERFTEQGDAITFESEVDKIYVSTPTKIAILDHEKKRTFVIRKDGLPDAVVWNPWDKKSKAMADFGDDEYKHMLCVESAAVENPITLRPGEEWKGRQELSAVPSSYCSGQLDPQRVLQGS
ncbi:hypothetical protein Scep_023286 [Stephania cephalantha]|uniref:glucose-6-phosphate 1-epimerase n=1 Tax=Stephania cephalantha TaxID=152367 RepID=A0AAP0HX58_9MAGN